MHYLGIRLQKQVCCYSRLCGLSQTQVMFSYWTLKLSQVCILTQSYCVGDNCSCRIWRCYRCCRSSWCSHHQSKLSTHLRSAFGSFPSGNCQGSWCSDHHWASCYQVLSSILIDDFLLHKMQASWFLGNVSIYCSIHRGVIPLIMFRFISFMQIVWVLSWNDEDLLWHLETLFNPAAFHLPVWPS